MVKRKGYNPQYWTKVWKIGFIPPFSGANVVLKGGNFHFKPSLRAGSRGGMGLLREVETRPGSVISPQLPLPRVSPPFFAQLRVGAIGHPTEFRRRLRRAFGMGGRAMFISWGRSSAARGPNEPSAPVKTLPPAMKLGKPGDRARLCEGYVLYDVRSHDRQTSNQA